MRERVGHHFRELYDPIRSPERHKPRSASDLAPPRTQVCPASHLRLNSPDEEGQRASSRSHDRHDLDQRPARRIAGRGRQQQ